MYLIIVGLGGIGRSLTAVATRANNSVVVIDKDEKRCADVLEHYDVLAITGSSTDKDVLEAAGIERADALVATTSDDSVNLMTCWSAKHYDVPNVVSIVNKTEHSEFFKEVGVKISENPDELVANMLYYWSRNPNLTQFAHLPSGSVFEIRVDENSPIIDKEIREVEVKDFVFVAIQRAGGGLIIPSGSVKIRPNDIITVFTKKEAEDETLKMLNAQLISKGGSKLI